MPELFPNGCGCVCLHAPCSAAGWHTIKTPPCANHEWGERFLLQRLAAAHEMWDNRSGLEKNPRFARREQLRQCGAAKKTARGTGRRAAGWCDRRKRRPEPGRRGRGKSALPDGVCSGNDGRHRAAAARGGQHRAQNRRAACAAHPNLGERYEGTFDDFLDLFQNWRIYVRRRIRHAAAAAKGRRGEARLGHG